MTQSLSPPPSLSQPIALGGGVISREWYRWLYALAQQAWTGNGAGAVATEALANAAADAQTTANAAVTDAATAQTTANSAATAAADAQTTANAAQTDATTALSDIAALAPGGSPVAVTVGSSPFVYAAAEPGTVFLSGGGITALAISRSGPPCAIGAFRAPVPLSAGDSLSVTWTQTAPTMAFFPR